MDKIKIAEKSDVKRITKMLEEALGDSLDKQSKDMWYPNATYNGFIDFMDGYGNQVSINITHFDDDNEVFIDLGVYPDRDDSPRVEDFSIQNISNIKKRDVQKLVDKYLKDALKRVTLYTEDNS